MVTETLDPASIEHDPGLSAFGRGVALQHHRPVADGSPFHLHPSIELNLLDGCAMTYAFGDSRVRVPEGRLCVFWAARPHRVADVEGEGTITNALIDLRELWSWHLPADLTHALIAGAVLLAPAAEPGDLTLARRWAGEVDTADRTLQRLHCLELQARLMRLALSGWTVAAEPTRDARTRRLTGNAVLHFEKMLHFVAMRYADEIDLADIAGAAGVSRNYANTLFKRILGVTVMAHVRLSRLQRAKALLARTDDKILSVALDSGFRSLSAFYETFHDATGTAPVDYRRAVRQGDANQPRRTRA